MHVTSVGEEGIGGMTNLNGEPCSSWLSCMMDKSCVLMCSTLSIYMGKECHCFKTLQTYALLDRICEISGKQRVCCQLVQKYLSTMEIRCNVVQMVFQAHDKVHET